MSRLAATYTLVARALLGALVAVILVNLALYPFPSLRRSAETPTPIARFGLDRLRPAYPGWSAGDLVRLHDESRVIFQYAPIVEFKIRPMSGTYVNASPHGFRVNARQAPWPPVREAFNVFVFGGSTAFGWLLPDRDTIASQLQDLAGSTGCKRQIAVYNFGQPSYISTQEALFFQSLVTAGTAPDLAVFVDGLNEFFFRGEMAFTPELQKMMDGTHLYHRLGALIDLPMYQLARRLRAKLPHRGPPAVDLAAEEKRFREIIAQWMRNKQSIETVGRTHGIATAFVWQPVPSFKYDLDHHFLYRDEPFGPEDPVPLGDIGRAYALMEAARPDLEKQGRFLWLADVQEHRRENLYVDSVHYNAKFSQEIASEVFAFLKSQSLLGCGD